MIELCLVNIAYHCGSTNNNLDLYKDTFLTPQGRTARAARANMCSGHFTVDYLANLFASMQNYTYVNAWSLLPYQTPRSRYFPLSSVITAVH